jgi:2-dehydropantoate 2-reductase
MKIAIFGSGAVGGYIGGRLAQAGLDVTFIARGKHLEKILSEGLRVDSINGNFSVYPAKATRNTHSIGHTDLVFCCVKSWQVKGAADAIRPMVGPHTVVIPIQNGVEAHIVLSEALGAEHVLPGLCRFISLVRSPGVICHVGSNPYLAFGEIDGHKSERLEKLYHALANVDGLTVDISQNIHTALWEKFMLVAPWSGLGAITRSPVGVFRKLPETREILLKSIQEVFNVARAHGVSIEDEAVDDTLAFMDSLPPAGTSSMQRDIIEGRPSELNEQSGAVVRFGKTGGVKTPVNEFFYHCLLPLELKARDKITF